MIITVTNFFDAFKMAVCNFCGREVLANGLESHVKEHAIYWSVEEELHGQEEKD